MSGCTPPAAATSWSASAWASSSACAIASRSHAYAPSYTAAASGSPSAGGDVGEVVGGVGVAVDDLQHLLEVGGLVGGQDDVAVGEQGEVLELGREPGADAGQDVGPADPDPVVLLRLGPAQCGEAVGDVVEVDVVVDPQHLDRAVGRLGEQLPA